MPAGCAHGSRTVTAGSELHRPRNTRELSTRQSYADPTRRRRDGRWHPAPTAPGSRAVTPSRASQARATRAGASASSLSMAVEAPAQASTAASAVGASRSSAKAARICASTSSAFSAGVQPDGLAPAAQPLLGGGQHVVGPLPVVAVVVGEQREPDGHRVDAGLARAWRRRPGCPATWTSSPRRGRPSRCAGRPGRTAGRWPPGLRRRDISWCGKIRSLPPPWTSKSVPEQVQRDRRALDVPARPARARAGSPRPARPARPAARPDSPAAPSCPGGRGRRRARRRPASASPPARRRQRAELGVAGLGEVQVGVLRVVDRVHGSPVLQRRDQLDDLRDRLDGADVGARAAARSARPCPRDRAGSAARRATASRRPSAAARSSSGSSTSVTFCT